MDPSHENNQKDYSFARVCDLKVPVEVKICFLEGKLPEQRYSEILADPSMRHAYMKTDGLSDLHVSIQLFTSPPSTHDPPRALTLPFRTPTKAFTAKALAHGSGSTPFVWNTVLGLPTTYAALPRDARLAVTLWDVARSGEGRAVGGATLELFNQKGTLKRGQQRVYLHPGLPADPAQPSTTPSTAYQADERARLERLVRQYERGDVPRVEWMDALAFRRIERIHAEEARTSDKMFLYLDLPRFDFPVVFAEQEAALPLPPQPQPSLAPASPSPLPQRYLSTDPHLWRLYDPESIRIRGDPGNGSAGAGRGGEGGRGGTRGGGGEMGGGGLGDLEGNLVEAKHRRLVRSHRTGAGARDLKPGPEVRDLLNELFAQPPTYTLSPEDKDLIWRYRYSLPQFSKRSLTKFLKSVTWSDAGEARQAVEVLLPMWTEVGMDDALELLGVEFGDGRVRAFAVRQLRRAEDDEILNYLLQLVQALKFEPRSSSSRPKPHRSGSRASRTTSTPPPEERESGLADFLIERAVRNAFLGTAFHWYLMVECEDRVRGKMYAKVAFQFMTRLVETEEGAARREVLRRQGELVATLSQRAKDLRGNKDPRPRKIEKLRAFIHDSKNALAPLPSPLTLPLNPRIEVTGIVAERSSVFKSNLFPMLLWFQSNSEAGEYPIIFKNGDDLRQDQLVIQLFTLMDRIMCKDGLDLKLSPYAVLATGTIEGMIQFVPSKSLHIINQEHGNLLNYLKIDHADEGAIGTMGLEPAVMDTFIRSCAGYSVMTYILGVGDRHLDNLMLAPDGHFFHVDFGYILGRDPKPFPPPVKVCKEMIDALGGPESVHYTKFKSYCYSALIILRKNANLILNLIALMVDANIQDIRLEPDKAVLKVQEKFMLDISEEDAIKQFEAILNDTSYLTMMFDKVHTLAQFLRD